MTKASVDYREGLIADLRNPVEAAAYINAAFEDGSQKMLLLALQDVAEAMEINKLENQEKLNEGRIDRPFSVEDSSILYRLSDLLQRVGLKLAVEAKSSIVA